MKTYATLAAALIATQAVAYDHRLGSHAIREAYFIGSGGRYAEVLSTYTKNLPAPKTGPHVAQIEVRTPFAQVIVNSHDHSVGYSSMDADQDYKKNPDTLQVRIQIRATATYALASIAAAPLGPCQGVQRMNSVEECLRDFHFGFSQGKDLKPKSIYGVPMWFAKSLRPTFKGIPCSSVFLIAGRFFDTGDRCSLKT